MSATLEEVLARNGLDGDTSKRGVYRLREMQRCCGLREDCRHFGGNARRVLETVARLRDGAARDLERARSIRRTGQDLDLALPYYRAADAKLADIGAILAKVLR